MKRIVNVKGEPVIVEAAKLQRPLGMTTYPIRFPSRFMRCMPTEAAAMTNLSSSTMR